MGGSKTDETSARRGETMIACSCCATEQVAAFRSEAKDSQTGLEIHSLRQAAQTKIQSTLLCKVNTDRLVHPIENETCIDLGFVVPS